MVWTFPLILWLYTLVEEHSFASINLFKQVLEIINPATLYSAYWTNALIILISTVIVPATSEDYESFYDAFGIPQLWIGTVYFCFYLLIAALDTFMQITFTPEIYAWAERAQLILEAEQA